MRVYFSIFQRKRRKDVADEDKEAVKKVKTEFDASTIRKKFKSEPY
jgi:hypothetical protein